MAFHANVALDGSVLLYTTEDGLVKVWDTINHIPLQSPNLVDDKLLSAYFSADKKYIIGINQDGKLSAWNTDNGEKQGVLGNSVYYKTLVIHPNASVVAVALDDGSVLLWDVSNNHIQLLLQENQHKVESLHWSPDGTRLLGSIAGRGIWLWNMAQAKEIVVKPDEDLVGLEGLESTNIHPLGNLLLQGFERGAYVILNIETGKTRVLSAKHREPLYSVKWNVNGDRYVLGGYYGSIDVLDTRTNTILRSIKLEGTPHNLEWQPDTSKIVGFLLSGTTAIPNAAIIINADTGEVEQIKGNVFTAAWSIDTTKYAYIQIQDEQTSLLHIHRIAGLPSNQVLPKSVHEINTMRWQPDNRHICLGGYNGRLYVWDTDEERLVAEIEAHSSVVNVIAWHPNRALLASGGDDHKLVIWDVMKQELIHSFWLMGRSGA